MVHTPEENKALIERYPFLLPRNRWTDEVVKDFDYSYTELDDMPDGWRIAFGEQMCEDIREELLRIGHLDKYRITQIKEKYGYLRWYDRGHTEKMSKEIFPKYVRLSQRTCIQCGKPATQITTGWICPWCDECASELNERTISIEEYYAEIGQEDEEED